MKGEKKLALYLLYMVLGVILIVLGSLKIVDSFWSGMGGALIAMGVIRTCQILRSRKDEAYREKQETERKDERNRFLREKAWTWAGFSFVMIAAVSSIVLKLLGQELLSMAAGIAVCILVLLYWVCYLVLEKKY